MATLLTKNVKRQLLASDRHGRTLIVELEPGDMLSFRLKGKRTRYETSLHNCYVLAVANTIEGQYKVKMAEHKAGKRSRKPKAPSMAMFARAVRMALQG